MARTFVDQPTQIFHSDYYDDSLATGIGLQTGSTSVEDDLNAIRTQVRQLLWASVSGSWYDAVPSVTGVYGTFPSRGVNTLGADLKNLEQHRFLYRSQILNTVSVGTGSNYALLSVSLGTAPANYAVVNEPVGYSTGTMLASTTYGAWSNAIVSGTTVLTPKNLVLVRDAFTHQALTSSVGINEIFGLLQAESGTVSGDAFNDSTKRTQISFVYEATVLGTSSLVAANAIDVGGRVLNYSYVKRSALSSLPEDAYLSDNIFIDVPPSFTGTMVSLSDITLQRAITNQGATVVTDTAGTNIQLGQGSSWTFLSGTTPLWTLAAGANTLVFNLTKLSVSSTLPTSFQQGVSVATGSTQINLGVTPGWIDSVAGLTVRAASGSNLVLSGGSQVVFGDGFGGSSTYPSGLIPLATASLEWSNFYSAFGARSLLGAMTFLSNSLSGASLTRSRAQAGTTTGGAGIAPNTNVTYPTNLDAPLLNYTGKSFTNNMNIYLNGVLLYPGTDSTNSNDVYPGTSPTTGDLKFPMKIRSGSIITMELFSS